jgi:hypothetical protein
MMPSAIERDSFSLPAFNRFTWAESGLYPGNVLCVADPTLFLNDNLGFAWFLGGAASDVKPLEVLSRLIELICARLNIGRSDVYIWGSSAGGYSALALKSYLPFSNSISINAQFNLLKYNSPSQISLIKETCFPFYSNENELFEAHSDVLDASNYLMVKMELL